MTQLSFDDDRSLTLRERFQRFDTGDTKADERLRAKVAFTDDGHWMWIGAINAYGYGVLTIRAPRKNSAFRTSGPCLHPSLPRSVMQHENV